MSLDLVLSLPALKHVPRYIWTVVIVIIVLLVLVQHGANITFSIGDHI